MTLKHLHDVLIFDGRGFDAEQAAVMTLRSDSSFGQIASAPKSIAELLPQ
jgi:hypothetical protein